MGWDLGTCHGGQGRGPRPGQQRGWGIVTAPSQPQRSATSRSVPTSCYWISPGQTSQRSPEAPCAHHIVTAQQPCREAKLTAPEDPGLEPPFSLPPPPPSSQPPRGQLLLPSLLEPAALSCLPLCGPPPSGSPPAQVSLQCRDGQGHHVSQEEEQGPENGGRSPWSGANQRSKEGDPLPWAEEPGDGGLHSTWATNICVASVWALFLWDSAVPETGLSRWLCPQTAQAQLGHTHQGSLPGCGGLAGAVGGSHSPRKQRWRGFRSPACPPAPRWSWSGRLRAGIALSPAHPRGSAPALPLPTAPRELTDLQLPLDAPLAALAVVGLRGVVLGHDLHKLAGQRGVLGHDVGVQVSGPAPQSPRASSARQPTPDTPSSTCVFRILRSADERLRPSSCSMLCSMPGRTEWGGGR